MKSQLEKSAEETFVELFSGNLDNLVQELSETSMNLLLSDEIASNIPVVRSFVSLAKMGTSIRDYIFAKKLISFLAVSSKIPAEKRDDFTSKIESDAKYRTKVGEMFINCIEKCRDTENVEQIAYLSNACIRGEMEYDDFLRCASIVMTVSSGSLRDFVLSDIRDISGTSLDELTSSGLYRINLTPFSVKVKDDDELKQEAELKKEKLSLASPMYEALSSVSDIISKPFRLSYPLSPFMTTSEPEGKYHSTVKGGQIEFYVSTIGLFIKEALRDYYKEVS